MNPKTIVVSAVSIRRGGTLRILRDCLKFLSEEMTVAGAGYRVVAVVHKRELADFPGIEYIEIPEVVGNWVRRMWCEYVTMHKISRRLAPVYLWLSLHDTTPRVEAERQAMYCQTSFPFLKLRFSDFIYGPKIVLFSLFTRYAYQINIHRNRDIIVQARWLKDGFSKMFGVDSNKFIVAPPQEEKRIWTSLKPENRKDIYNFSFIGIADCHKNFETICRAAEILEHEIGKNRFQICLTIDGSENAYASSIVKRWGKVKSIKFMGYLSREDVSKLYDETDCLIFPSRIETWGLPVSEFRSSGRPMLISDLPYAHEASAGSDKVSFFNPDKPDQLALMMGDLVNGNTDFLRPVQSTEIDGKLVKTWSDLFANLLK